MEKKYFIPLLFLFCSLFVFNSCENEDPDDSWRRDNLILLCRNVWVDNYYTDDYEYCHQELTFREDGAALNYREFYKTDPNGNPYGAPEVVSIPFRWYWDDECQEALIFVYNDGSRSYFDNVWVRQHYLSGRLDGQPVLYIDSKLSE